MKSQEIGKMFHETYLNSSDLYITNPAQHFLGITNVNGGTTESLIAANAGSEKENALLQSDSEEFFKNSQGSECAGSQSLLNNRVTSFNKYIPQKPICGKSGIFGTKAYRLGRYLNPGKESEETDSSLDKKSGNEKQLVQRLLQTVSSLSAEVKALKGMVEVLVKKNNEHITSGQRNAEEVCGLVQKFETFLCAYKERERMLSDIQQKTTESSDAMKNEFKSMEDAVLKSNAKTSESCCETQESLKVQMMETLQSVKDIVTRETERQVNQACTQFLLACSQKHSDSDRKNAEFFEDLKSYLSLSFQSLKDMKHEKPDCQAPCKTDVNSASEAKFPPLSTRTAVTQASTKPPSKPFRETPGDFRKVDHDIRTRSNLVPLMSLKQNYRTSKNTRTVPEKDHCVTVNAGSKDNKKNKVFKPPDTYEPSDKENSANVSRVECLTIKRKQDANHTSSVIQVTQDIYSHSSKHFKGSKTTKCPSESLSLGCDVSGDWTEHKAGKNSFSDSENSDDECDLTCTSSPCFSVSEIPFVKKALDSVITASGNNRMQLVSPSQNLTKAGSSPSDADQIWM